MPNSIISIQRAIEKLPVIRMGAASADGTGHAKTPDRNRCGVYLCIFDEGLDIMRRQEGVPEAQCCISYRETRIDMALRHIPWPGRKARRGCAASGF